MVPQPDLSAKIQIPAIGQNGVLDLSLWYYMWGGHIGKLEIIAETIGGLETTVFSTTGSGMQKHVLCAFTSVNEKLIIAISFERRYMKCF